MNIEHLNGLEIMTGLLDGRRPVSPMAEFLSLRAVEIGSGEVIFTARADKHHINYYGGVYSGYTAALLDYITCAAVITMLEPGYGCSSIDMHIKVLKHVPQGKELVVWGKALHVTKKEGSAEGTVKDEEGNLYASASVTCTVYKLDELKKKK